MTHYVKVWLGYNNYNIHAVQLRRRAITESDEISVHTIVSCYPNECDAMQITA